MNEQTRRLVRFQEVSFEIRGIEEAKSALPAQVEAVEQAFEVRIGEIGAARQQHQALVDSLARTTAERDDLQNRLKASQQRLLQVNNPREYSAALNEIDQYKANIQNLEDRMLEAEVQIEALAGPAAEADARIAAERADVEARKRQLEVDAARHDGRLAELHAEADEIRQLLAPELVKRFESIARARGGVAIVRIVESSCAGCHVRLRPQVINLVRRGTELIACESCRRLLYIDDSPAQGGDGHEAAASQAG